MAKKIADKLRERIRFRHATHEEIAKRAKLPPETVSNFMEHGEISLDDAEILLETLDSWREPAQAEPEPEHTRDANIAAMAQLRSQDFAVLWFGENGAFVKNGLPNEERQHACDSWGLLVATIEAKILYGLFVDPADSDLPPADQSHNRRQRLAVALKKRKITQAEHDTAAAESLE